MNKQEKELLRKFKKDPFLQTENLDYNESIAFKKLKSMGLIHFYGGLGYIGVSKKGTLKIKELGF